MKIRCSSAWDANEDRYVGCEQGIARLELLAQTQKEERALAALYEMLQQFGLMGNFEGEK